MFRKPREKKKTCFRQLSEGQTKKCLSTFRRSKKQSKKNAFPSTFRRAKAKKKVKARKKKNSVNFQEVTKQKKTKKHVHQLSESHEKNTKKNAFPSSFRRPRRNKKIKTPPKVQLAGVPRYVFQGERWDASAAFCTDIEDVFLFFFVWPSKG